MVEAVLKSCMDRMLRRSRMCIRHERGILNTWLEKDVSGSYMLVAPRFRNGASEMKAGNEGLMDWCIEG